MWHITVTTGHCQNKGIKARDYFPVDFGLSINFIFIPQNTTFSTLSALMSDIKEHISSSFYMKRRWKIMANIS